MNILPLNFSVVLQYKGEAAHSLSLLHSCMVAEWPSHTVHIAVGGSMGSLVGRMVAPDHGRVGCSVSHF